MTITETTYHPDRNLVVTHIGGSASSDDVARWEASLHETLNTLADNSSFRIFINLHGFKAENFDVHKQFRDIVPLTLADYGFRAGYVDLFENVDLPLQHKRGIRCTKAAHCHQDATKIEMYESRFGRDNERFFTDPEKAEAWISE
jgi:hypothetical protein